MKEINRRDFLKKIGAGAAVVSAASITGCTSADNNSAAQAGDGKMTYRTNPRTKEQVSILGYGCMRWPMIGQDRERGITGVVDQEAVNSLVDYALEHGVNYFDMAPVYLNGLCEEATGVALSRHPRNSYFVATKLSTHRKELWTLDVAKEMYANSMKKIGVDYIDYYLLHSTGGEGSIENVRARFFDNGVMDFLLAEREAGRIRNLGFSFHGSQEIFDYMLSLHDEIHWDFVQIQMNYVDWNHAQEQNKRNVDASYLYGELEKRGIPVVIMEPLLGGRLSKLSDNLLAKLNGRDPDRSAASWAFRFAGSFDNVLTVLSGMTYMEHLQDNLKSYSSLVPLKDEDKAFLEDVALLMLRHPQLPCNYCQYCMPCPYGLDIPGIFKNYNACLAEDALPTSSGDPDYRRNRRRFLKTYNQVEQERQAEHCIGCRQCIEHCPQNIDIPKQMARIEKYVDNLRFKKEF